MANDDECNQHPEKLRQSPLRFIDDSHDEEADGDFGEAEVDRDEDLRNETPFRYVGDALKGQADQMLTHARLNSFRISSEGNNAKHLIPH